MIIISPGSSLPRYCNTPFISEAGTKFCIVESMSADTAVSGRVSPRAILPIRVRLRKKTKNAAAEATAGRGTDRDRSQKWGGCFWEPEKAVLKAPEELRFSQIRSRRTSPGQASILSAPALRTAETCLSRAS